MLNFAIITPYSTACMNPLKVNTPNDFLSVHGLSSPHPLVGVVDYGAIAPVRHVYCDYGVYGVFINTNISGEMRYGGGRYDYSSGALICVAPGQTGGIEDNGELVNLRGYGLLFHPDLIRGTHLGDIINRYTFFEYNVSEALFLSDDEFDEIAGLIKRIVAEIEKPYDDVQDLIIVSHIELILNYCQRFFNRQFAMRKIENDTLLSKIEIIIKDYFVGDMPSRRGLPDIKYVAGKLCLSSNYASDLIKKATGEKGSTYLRKFIVREAKNRLTSGKSVSETAYSLGFDYPQHFTRMFKSMEGITPMRYLNSIKSRSDK